MQCRKVWVGRSVATGLVLSATLHASERPTPPASIEAKRVEIAPQSDPEAAKQTATRRDSSHSGVKPIAIGDDQPSAKKSATRRLPPPVMPLDVKLGANKKLPPPYEPQPLPKAAPPAKQKLRVVGGKIMPLPGRIYQGAFADFGGEEDKVTQQAISAWETKIGRKLGIVTFSLNFGKAIKYPRNALALVHKNKATSLVRLMPRADFSKPKKGVTPKYSLTSIVAGHWDAQLKALAHDFKVFDVPVFMDFAPEMNGNWFHWAGVWNGGAHTASYGAKNLADGPELYRDAYRHIIDLFRSVGAHKVTWIFHVDAWGVDDKGWNAIKNYYPGTDYIDWLGLSFYGAHEVDQYMLPFDGVMKKAYRSLSDLDPGKPIFLSEFGASEISGDPLAKAKWIKAAGQALVSRRYPKIHAISYWHENYHSPNSQPALLRLDSSLTALSMYRLFIANEVFFP